MSSVTAETRFAAENRQLPGAVLTETIQLLASHASVRHYKPDPVPPEAVEAILTAARSAPTSSNLQMYSIVVVTDEERRARLAELSGNQEHVRQAPLFLAFCPDLNRLERVCQRQGYPFADRYTEMFIQAVVDAALVAQNASIAAESLGLGTCMIGGIRNRPREVAQLLGLPPRTFALVGLTVGYPAQRPNLKPRLPEQVTVHRERYDDRHLEEGLAAYDEIMAATGIYAGREVKAPGADGSPRLYGWCEHSARRMSRPHPTRRHIKETLEELGWEF
ncbi:MAG: NADPH-dependent oxidoreductase [Firmicutes bacterium]|nr:NADPH-dependent oxidoreductase [Bacillota bacterium]